MVTLCPPVLSLHNSDGNIFLNSNLINVTVYDVSSRQTFDELLKWFKEIDTYCGEGVVKMVVGNKVDKEFSRQVSTEEGRVFAERMGTLFIGVSKLLPAHTLQGWHRAKRGFRMFGKNEDWSDGNISGAGSEGMWISGVSRKAGTDER